jgi:uncharacterized membrane protein YjjP (DUF1212 family)
MNLEITIESLLAIAIGFISSGVALVTAGKIIEGVIVTIIGFALIATRAFLKIYRC